MAMWPSNYDAIAARIARDSTQERGNDRRFALDCVDQFERGVGRKAYIDSPSLADIARGDCLVFFTLSMDLQRRERVVADVLIDRSLLEGKCGIGDHSACELVPTPPTREGFRSSTTDTQVVDQSPQSGTDFRFDKQRDWRLPAKDCFSVVGRLRATPNRIVASHQQRIDGSLFNSQRRIIERCCRMITGQVYQPTSGLRQRIERDEQWAGPRDQLSDPGIGPAQLRQE